MRRAAVLLLIASGLSSRGVRAAEPPVAVAIAECPTAPVAAEAFLRSLRVELAGEGRACCTRVDLAAPAVPGTNPARLTVDGCGATPDLVQVSVRDERSGAARDRQVALADVPPDARPRALALAVAELLREAAAAPAAAPAVVSPPAPAPGPLAERVDGWIPMLGIAVQNHPSGGITLWGFHAALELARGTWQATLGGHVDSAAPGVALGKVDTVFAGGSLELGARFHPGATTVDAGLVGGIGYVHMDGVTTVPNALAASGSGLESTAGARAAWDFWRTPLDHTRLRLVVEGGAVLHGVEATVNGQHAAGLTGAYVLGGLMATLGPF